MLEQNQTNTPEQLLSGAAREGRPCCRGCSYALTADVGCLLATQVMAESIQSTTAHGGMRTLVILPDCVRIQADLVDRPSVIAFWKSSARNKSRLPYGRSRN